VQQPHLPYAAALQALVRRCVCVCVCVCVVCVCACVLLACVASARAATRMYVHVHTHTHTHPHTHTHTHSGAEMRSGIDAAYKHLDGLHPLAEVPGLHVAAEDGVSEMAGGEEMMMSQEAAWGSRAGSRQGKDAFDEIEASLRDLGAGLLGQGPGPSLADLTGGCLPGWVGQRVRD
jgi:hypothetical protein